MIPPFQKIMLPLLEICKDGETNHLRKLTDILADKFELTQEDRDQSYLNRERKIFEDRVGWASSYLKKANLVTRKMSHITITQAGQDILRTNPKSINIKLLNEIPAYREYEKNKKSKKPTIESGYTAAASEQSPDDMISDGYQQIRDSVEAELLERINKNTPQFFEGLVSDLLQKMYHGDAKVLGRTGDGGIDGIITEDTLGFSEIYFQAKRWRGTVPIHNVRDFAGALTAHKSKKGVFITSSSFSKDASEFVKYGDAKIILIDGHKLIEYMYDYNLGVNTKYVCEIKQIDEYYFPI